VIDNLLKKLNKISVVLILCVPSLLPLFFVTGISRNFDFPRSMIFRSICLFLILMFALKVVLQRKMEIKLKYFTDKTFLLFFFLSFVLFLATVFSPHFINSIHGTYERGQGLIQWVFYLIFFFLFLQNIQVKHLKVFLFMSLSGSFLISLYAILQKVGFDPFFSRFDTDFFVGRSFSTLGNPDFLGQYLGPLIPLVFLIFLITKKKVFKILFLISFLILLGGIFVSESRSPVFGFFCTGVIFAIFLIKKHQISMKKIILFICLFLFLGITALKIPFIHDLPLVQRFSFDDVHSRSLSVRFLVWDTAFKIIKSHPLLGVGPENFALYVPAYINEKFYELEEDLNINADRVHNDILEFGAASGIFSIIFYLGVIWLSIVKLFQTEKKDFVTQFVILSLLIYFFQNFFSFSETVHFVLFISLLSWQIILTNKNIKLVEILKLNYSRWPILFISLVFLVYVSYHSVIKPVSAEAWYTDALMAYNAGYFEDSETYLENAIAVYPQISRFHYDLMMRFSWHTPQEIEVLKRIEGETVNLMAWEAVALSMDEPESAYKIFEKLILINPANIHVRRAYADAFFRNKEYEKAAKEYEAYLNLTPQFWTWCSDINDRSYEERRKYRVFLKNVPDFTNSLIHIIQSLEQAGDLEKKAQYEQQFYCIKSTKVEK